ncbi:hypothetical protein DXG01_007713 [Tephrocybe rancida]|nr:hypothetical protein DXG01_007713 [Tephrocybe rancida]
MSDAGAPPVIPTELQQYDSYITDPKWQIKFTIIWTSVLAFFAIIALPAILRGRRMWAKEAFGVTENWRRKYNRLPDKKTQPSNCGGTSTPKSIPRRKSRALVARVVSTLGSVFYWTPPIVGLNAGQIFLIVGYIAAVLACICTSSQLLSNPNRAGFLALAQLTPVFLLASKNTALSLLLPPFFAYTRLNALHRWTGRTLFIAGALHGGLWINNHLVWDIQIIGEQKETSGVAALGVLCMIVLSSLRPVRMWAWGVFYWVHYLAVPAFFITVCYHTTYAAPWIYPPIAIYAFDLFMRAGRFRLKDARLIPVDDQMTIIHIPDCDAGFQAGQHLRLRVFFGGRVFESHPLSIMSAPSAAGHPTTCLTAGDMEAYYTFDTKRDSDSIESTEEPPTTPTSDLGAGIILGARAAGDWTKSLNAYARDWIQDASLPIGEPEGDEESRAGSSSPTSSSALKEVPTSVPVQVMFDGPYGGCSIDLAGCERVVLVAGGSGATFAIGCMDALVALCASPPPGVLQPRTRRIHFVWCTRSPGSLSWFTPLLGAIARTAVAAGVRLTMTVYVTCMCSPDEARVPGLEVRVGGRPDLGRVVRGVPVGHIGMTLEGGEGLCSCGCVDEALRAQAEEEEEEGNLRTDEEKGETEGRGREETVGVCASGPESLTREAANAVARHAAGGRQVGFHAEIFAAYKTIWGLKTPGTQRGRLLSKLADLLENDLPEFAALEALNVGKFDRKGFLSASGEIASSVSILRYYAGWADKVQGKTIEPSEVTPLTALRFADLINKAGFPPGVVNIVNGLGITPFSKPLVSFAQWFQGRVVGSAISEHPLISKVSFTGSAAVGRSILRASSDTNLKNVTLELGGKSPSIIFDDADIEQAVKWAAFGIFFNAGQVCVAGSRIFVQEGIYDSFVQQFSAVANALASATGDPFQPNTQHGPLVSQAQFDRVMAYIDSGKSDGAKVLAGGERHGSEGYFVQPTIFTDVRPDMKIVREEIFGPVASIIKFTTEEEVIEAANNTEYGLWCSVFSQNISRALRVAHSMEAGTAMINASMASETSVPFGGYKQSGIGREMGDVALETYTQVKAVHVNIGQKL